MTKRLSVVLLVLFGVLLINIVRAEQDAKPQIKYWTKTDSDISTEQIISWLKTQPYKIIFGGITTGFAGVPVPFVIVNTKAPDNNALEILFIRNLFYKDMKEDNKMILAGFTIHYTNKTLSFKYNTKNHKYMEFNYRTNKFKYEDDDPEEFPGGDSNKINV